MIEALDTSSFLYKSGYKRGCLDHSKIDQVPKEFLPYFLLTPREREILQFHADGLMGNTSQGLPKNISSNTLVAHRQSISHIGLGERKSDRRKNKASQVYPREVVLALIQDGINYGYIPHEAVGIKMEPLTTTEKQVLKCLSQGMYYKEITTELGIASPRSVEYHARNAYSKLGVKNLYHAVARITYLKLHGILY